TPRARLPAALQVVLLPQFLRQVRVVEPDVHRLHQAGDLLAHGLRQPPRRRPPPSTMPQGRGTPELKAPLEPLNLPDAQTQRRRRLSVGDPARTDRLQQPRAMQLLPAQRESLHGGMTLSRSSYPMTFSCSTSKEPAPVLTIPGHCRKFGARLGAVCPDRAQRERMT